MDEPIVISPTIAMGEYLCREILSINPRKHVMPMKTAAEHGLRGLDRPVVILYPDNLPDLWKSDQYMKVLELLQICRAKVISMAEVRTIN